MADIETLLASTRYFVESSAPSTPSSGTGVLYAATDGTLHYLNDGATDTELGAGGGGSVATDAIFDAKGDLAVGTGADTAARLAVGTDDHVLTADSGEATGLKWAAAPGGSSLVSAGATRTAGDVNVSSSTWTAVDTGMDLVVAAVASDICMVSISGLWENQSAIAGLDFATIVSASPVNYGFSGGSTANHGMPGCIGAQAGEFEAIAGVARYVVQAGDISGGNVTFRLMGHVASSNRDIRAQAGYPLHWNVVNIGQ